MKKKVIGALVIIGITFAVLTSIQYSTAGLLDIPGDVVAGTVGTAAAVTEDVAETVVPPYEGPRHRPRYERHYGPFYEEEYSPEEEFVTAPDYIDDTYPIWRFNR